MANIRKGKIAKVFGQGGGTQSNLPWATHLFYRDNKFMINSRDERSYVVGVTWEYDTINEAIDKFMSILQQTINAEHLASELGFSHPYSSPLWDED